MTDFTPARIAELRALGAKATKLPYRQHLVDDTTIIAEDAGGYVPSPNASPRRPIARG